MTDEERLQELSHKFTQLEQHIKATISHSASVPEVTVYINGIGFSFDYGGQGVDIWLDIQDISRLASYLNQEEPELEADFSEWDEFMKELEEHLPEANPWPPMFTPHDGVPHKCPVCDGKGVVPHGFYNTSPYFSSTNIAPETCRSCYGQGVIWS